MKSKDCLLFANVNQTIALKKLKIFFTIPNVSIFNIFWLFNTI